MSNEVSKATFQDGTVLYFEFYGSVSLAHSDLYKSKDEVHENWRSEEKNKCTCGKSEDVALHTPYGGGIDWEAKACKLCKAITDGHDPFAIPEELEYGSGYW